MRGFDLGRSGFRRSCFVAGLTALALPSAAVAATQQVFLDFDSQTTGGEHAYTPAERAAILANIASDYSGFDFTFSLTAPAGPFTTLFFNSGGAGGLAAEIDFRNLNLSSSAQININGVIPSGAPSADWIGITSTIGAHELGHTVGLRHYDSLGPIGKGINSTLAAKPDLPSYPGPTNLAVETGRHTMASPASVGQTIAQATADTYLGEREVARLKFNETGTVVNEQAAAHNSIINAQPLALGDLGFVPNKLKPGDENFGAVFDVDAVAVTGNITSSGQLDYYSFSGTEGQLFNFEVISKVLNRYSANNIDPEIKLFNSGGGLVPYYASTAYNQDEFESFDSILLDLYLPATDTYFIEVSADALVANDTGNYELFFYSFAVPEPASLALLGFAGLFMTRRRARG